VSKVKNRPLYVVALGPCDDDTEKMLREIGDPKIRIVPTVWNEKLIGICFFDATRFISSMSMSRVHR
jgi:hypothetical protein